MERLQKILARSGVASRRKSEQLILEGRVSVDGHTVTELGTKVNPDQVDIKVDGQPIVEESTVYYLFHKPTGVITSVHDPQGRKVVLDYFQDINQRIYPIGRLDFDTSGLLLLTNDGALAHKLMHPSFHVIKGYLATVSRHPSEAALECLRKGVTLEDGPTAPAEVKRISDDHKQVRSTIKISIHEGRNRQVRRMFEQIGHPVIKLHRETYGFLQLHNLKSGQYRSLTPKEVNNLKELASNQA
ncbi:pseudouridine synthase [Caldalkalibacillus salinus]|uniref:pseudouridine synthase n=1 Tax=Caldalkalibacillus salinus TaxID=2803787 RepID=UPI0019218C12|nr:pseudouridine synthase [Caldalkalibacillus salinus]